MLSCMIKAKVGDDVFEDDPTVNELERYAAELFGKEKALFTTSGTQSNLIANILHAPSGSEIIMDHRSHPFLYESANVSRFAGSQIFPISTEDGILTPEIISECVRTDNVHFPRTTLVSIENTHNNGGGNSYTLDEMQSLFAYCQKNNIKMHIDGARIFNAIISQNYKPTDIGKNTDSLTFCLSKGLGCPAGSVLIGCENFINEARRVRKALGGGMRQTGFLAAAGVYALKNNIERLKEDHIRAKKLAETLMGLGLKSNTPTSNIIIWTPKGNRDALIQKLREKNILCLPFKKEQIRFVTHLDFTEEHLDTTISCLKELF